MQTVTLTISVPDEVASRFHALPPDTFNRFTVAVLPGLLDALDAAEGESGLYPEDADLADLPPLPASLMQPLGELLRQGFEDADAGRVIDGETFLANLRERAKVHRTAAAHTAIK